MVLAFGNVTNHSTLWVPSPTTRGSWDLLSSCVVTISLCAWTALHLNVPEHGTADRQWLRKSRWLVLGLVAPEMVVYVAWRQRREARRLLKEVRKYIGQCEPRSKFGRMVDYFRPMFGGKHFRAALNANSVASSPTTMSAADALPRPQWTMAHGFYVVMGGFAMDSSDASEPFLPEGKTRAALTTEGLLFVLKHEPDLLPDVSETQIVDKSKADGLKKLLVCIQAAWFCTSCISRLATSLPISLLELNAMGHAACALLIYAMWWEKPLDVSEPTLIKCHIVQPLLAYMWMSSSVSVEKLKSYDLHGRLRDEFDAFWMFQYPRLNDLVSKDAGKSHPKPDHGGGFHRDKVTMRIQFGTDAPPMPASDGHGPDSAHSEMASRHYKSTAASSVRYRLVSWLQSNPLSRWVLSFPAGLGVRSTAIDHVSSMDVERWALAYEAIEKYLLEQDVRSRHCNRSELYDEDSRVEARIGNMLPLIGSRPYEVWSGFAIAGALYGGLHLLAWDAPFPSHLEQVFWRIAASSITFTPLILLPIALVSDKQALGQGGADLMKMIRGQEIKRKDGALRFWFEVSLVIICIPVFAAAPLLWFSYVIGRVYLVVECFKNVAHLPPAVFENVSWATYLPHIM